MKLRLGLCQITSEPFLVFVFQNSHYDSQWCRIFIFKFVIKYYCRVYAIIIIKSRILFNFLKLYIYSCGKWYNFLFLSLIFYLVVLIAISFSLSYKCNIPTKCYKFIFSRPIQILTMNQKIIV